MALGDGEGVAVVRDLETTRDGELARKLVNLLGEEALSVVGDPATEAAVAEAVGDGGVKGEEGGADLVGILVHKKV